MVNPVRTRWGGAGMPVELTTFVGRREDITAVKAALSGFRDTAVKAARCQSSER
ncbi:hypothetical protein GCM10010222_80100 [Streptomyces tanashiensis]|nr:hypothetical protein GCM10010222_80100 [Streptomyces tanashiensis]